MGSFNSTCCISGMPITVGDQVKYFLITENPYEDSLVCYSHDMWFPRTWPLRAVYNDYGSIEDYDEDAPAVYALCQGFSQDLIEQGTGDNRIHDVPARKEMSFDEYLDAVWEGRMLVERENHHNYNFLDKPEKLKEMEEIEELPTLKGVEQVLTRAGFSIANSDTGYLVDEQDHGWVRVRAGGYHHEPSRLEAVLPTLQNHYAAMITVGTGNYAFGPEIQIMPKFPPKKDRHLSFLRDKNNTKKPLKVSQAMILSSVWDALLKIDDRYSIIRKEVQEFWDEDLNQELEEKELEEKKRIDPDLKERLQDFEGISKFAKRYRGSRSAVGTALHQSIIPFSNGLGEHFNSVVAKHAEKNFAKEQVDEFLDDVAGFIYLQSFLYSVRYWWRPSFTVGPQYDDYTAHKVWFETLASISSELASKRSEGMD